MELLLAMLGGALGAALLRRKVALWLATLLGILAGAGMWQLLALIGPGVAAGPLPLWHVGLGAVVGGAAMAILALLRTRLA